MRHIINIVGLTMAVTSTVIQSLKDLLPQYDVLVVDDFQQEPDGVTSEDESRAWRELWIATLHAEFSIIVSSGTSENLQMLLDRLWRAPGTNIVTIDLEGQHQSPIEMAEEVVKQLPVDFR